MPLPPRVEVKGRKSSFCPPLGLTIKIFLSFSHMEIIRALVEAEQLHRGLTIKRFLSFSHMEIIRALVEAEADI
jgi:hypothetical protein